MYFIIIQYCNSILYSLLMCYYDRSNSLNFLLGKIDGSTEFWTLGKLKLNGWLKVKKNELFWVNANLWRLWLFIQGRINSVMFYALWTFAPILVSIISFSTYVMLGNQLTIGVAFTVNFYTNTPSFYVSSVKLFLEQAIALFNMIRSVMLHLCLRKQLTRLF